MPHGVLPPDGTAAGPPPVGPGGAPPSPQRPARPAPRQSFHLFSLQTWRVRPRLVALILIPTIVAVLLGARSIYASVGTAAGYGQVEQMSELAARITVLVHELQHERDLTAGYIAGGREDQDIGTLRDQYSTVDRAAGDVRAQAALIGGDYPEGVQEDVRLIRNRLDQLSSLREIAAETRMPALPAIERYSLVVSDLLDFNAGIAQTGADQPLAESVRALDALSRAKEEVSRQRGILYSALSVRSLPAGERAALVAARAQQESDLEVFRTSATLEQRQAFEDTVTGREVDRSESIRLLAINTSDAGNTRLALGQQVPQAPQRWFESVTTVVDRMRAVEDEMVQSIIAQANALKRDAQQGAVVDTIFVLVVLLLVLLLTAIVARSMVRPLRRLRAGALEVAEHRLPDVVSRLREADAGTVGLDVDPIDVRSSDEIGEVARAFDEVHREAVRLAADEAILRSNVNAMFLNLSRRSQTLVERQIRLIDGLEQGEQDANRLSSLFKLDHLATRMRRNCENLLVLAGQESARRWSQPVPLVDVLRASVSEVEQYDRVNLRVQPGVAVIGRAVNDVVHLVAELVENATSFSPQDTKVVVTGHLLDGGGVMLNISDNGIGITPEELSEANWRLANPPVVDVSVSRRMGLFVVGRLAARHGVRVQLRPSQTSGLTALVLLPESVITLHASTPQLTDPGYDNNNRSLDGSPGFPRAAIPAGQAEPGMAGAGGGQAHGYGYSGGYGYMTTQQQQQPVQPMQPMLRRFDHRGEEWSAQPEVVYAEPARKGDERLPIFDSVESEWFRRRDVRRVRTMGAGTALAEPVTAPQPAVDSTVWRSHADDGWRAAEAAGAPSVGGVTPSGLPKRVPKANLVPGSAGSTGGVPASAPPPVRSPDTVRSRFSSLQQGVREGRAAAARGPGDTDDPGEPRLGRWAEGQQQQEGE